MMRKPLIVALAIVALVCAALGGMVTFGTSAPPPYLASIGAPFRQVDLSDLPAIATAPARDGTPMAYRVYRAPQANAPVVVAIHGSSAHGASLHSLAKGLRQAGYNVYTPDLRGHGGTGRRGDIDYSRQLDDDIADFTTMVRANHQNERLVLAGFSSGGGFVLHVAATDTGRAYQKAVLISPMLGVRAPTVRNNGDTWAQPYIPRIIALLVLNRIGVHAFDHLTTLAFAIAPNNPGNLTAQYSFLLMQAFATSDYVADLRNAHAPIAVLVGEKDELFDAALFAPTVQAVKADVPVVVVPALGHIGMTTDARALPALIAAVGSGPTQ